MPKTIELTIEINIQRVSCPGVWLCQDGGVSLIVGALGTNYETCSLPPTFPLQFHDKLYFRKSFQDTCALNNVWCLLNDETLYCELVQRSQDCDTGECIVLAQYLGSLSEILFPRTLCSNDGVDLLMRRTKMYPGILSPKIEIATKVRIDEVWKEDKQTFNVSIPNIRKCKCGPHSGPRQKPVCHSPNYHRSKCHTTRPTSKSRSRSPSQGSCTSIAGRAPDKYRCAPSNPACKRPTILENRRRRDLCVFNMKVKGDGWNKPSSDHEDGVDSDKHQVHCSNTEDGKVVIESRYVNDDVRYTAQSEVIPTISHKTLYENCKPCTCEICRRYYELFHADCDTHVS